MWAGVERRSKSDYHSCLSGQRAFVPAGVSKMRVQLLGRSRRRSAAACAAVALFGCACSTASSVKGSATSGTVVAVGAENEYANVIAQIGGKYVEVKAILSNPNTDPHSFEASPSVAGLVSSARLIVQNGADYDTFMNTIEAASPNSDRKVIDVQKLLGLRASTSNPHLWYSPRTMPAVAKEIARDLSALDAGHAAYFEDKLAVFDRSLEPWRRALSQFKASHPG